MQRASPVRKLFCFRNPTSDKLFLIPLSIQVISILQRCDKTAGLPQSSLTASPTSRTLPPHSRSGRMDDAYTSVTKTSTTIRYVASEPLPTLQPRSVPDQRRSHEPSSAPRCYTPQFEPV